MNGEEKADSTKQRILEVAGDLFSRFGYEGASVREIANQSDVNVAAISYHFGNKANLYWSIVQTKHLWLQQGMEGISESSESIEDLVIRSYRFLRSDQSAIRTTLKIMMSYGVPEPDGELREKILMETGPPGAEALASGLKSHVSSDVSEDSLNWAVNTLFGSIVYWSMMMSSSKAEIICERNPEYKEGGIENILRRLTRSVLEEISKNPK